MIQPEFAAMNSPSTFCFGTLALGKRYRKHAALLAADLSNYCPEATLVLLTDYPTEFAEFSNVVTVFHKQQSIGCYHDKRFVIQQALTRFKTCIFVDADLRILSPIAPDLVWQPGITCISFAAAQKHLETVFEHNLTAKSLLTKTADKLKLDITASDLKFVQAYLFVVTKDDGKEQTFLNYWNKISIWLELYGLINAEGFTIGLAAVKAEFPLHLRGESLEQIHFFKNWLERSKLKTGNPPSDQILSCFEAHEQIEFSSSSILDRLAKRMKPYRKIQRLVQAKLAAWIGSDFYYR
jgi:hypothetical protein